MAHATVLASFNVEEFGTERVERLTGRGDRRAHRRAARDHAVQRRRRSSCAAEPSANDGLDRSGVSTDVPPGVVRMPTAGIRSAEVTTWTFIWLMVLLKIPIVALFLLVRWAVRAPETAPEQDGGIGPRRVPCTRTTPAPRPPRPPRRGPHGDPAPALRRARAGGRLAPAPAASAERAAGCAQPRASSPSVPALPERPAPACRRRGRGRCVA